MRHISYIVTVFLIFLLSGCTGGLSVPTSMKIDAVSSGNTMPTALYFFALGSDDKFRKMDYSELMRAKQTKLGGDILMQNKIILPVKGRITKMFRLPPNTRYFGIVASFSNVSTSDNWRKIRSVNNGSNSMRLYIGRNSIR